jgi:hypothetical protein
MFASVAVAALLAAAAQAAPEAAPAEKPAAEAPAAAKGKPKTRRVCYENKGTGSRLERKTCVVQKVEEQDAEVPTDKAKPGA